MWITIDIVLLLTDSWMMIIRKTLDADEISISCIRINVVPDIARHTRLEDRATKNNNLVSQVLENPDTVIWFVVGTLA